MKTREVYQQEVGKRNDDGVKEEEKYSERRRY